MKTTYINPFGQAALEIIKNYGNITRVTETNTHINEVINSTPNQKSKDVNSIKEICYDKIRYYYHYRAQTKTDDYTYLFNEELETEDIISTHALLQATAITYGSQSYETDIVINTIKSIIKEKIEKSEDNIIDATLEEYIDIHNTTLNDIISLITDENIKLNELLLSKNRIIITYDDFITEYREYLEYRKPEIMYQTICGQTKKHLLTALITQKIRSYIKIVENKLKQVEPAKTIEEIGENIRTVEMAEKEKLIKNKYGRKINYTNFNDDKPTEYMPEAFPPCVQKTLNGIKSGGRNYAITLFLTPFLSYARLYPGVYSRHIKNPRIVDMDSTLQVTKTEIIPLIYEAAENCRPPLFYDQPQEKQNIKNKLGFGEGEIKYENSGKSPWYTPVNCENIKQQQPQLCMPCQDCKKIGNPISYYNRKRKLLLKAGDKDDRTTTTNGN